MFQCGTFLELFLYFFNLFHLIEFSWIIQIITASHEKNSALFCRYSALIASQIARRDDILHFHAIRAIAAIARYSAAIAAIAP